ncbi:MAG: peroxiredoxin family protein [Chloroflexota bacterium]|nr:peroxiredoxin family protein [Chloroflexota bacterium]
MARAYGEYLRRGATIAAVVIDSPGQNAAMVEKLALPFPIVSDPGGEYLIRPHGAWDPGGTMARPAIVVLSPAGEEAYRYVGADFMDRPDDGEVLAALDLLGLPPIEAAVETVPHGDPMPGPRAVPLPNLVVYMRGVRFAMGAMAARARDPFDRAEAERTATMAEGFIAAQAASVRLVN